MTLSERARGYVRCVKIDTDGTFWGVAKDPCDILGVGDVSQAIGPLDRDEKGTCTVRTLGGPQEMAVISEAGLYRLLMRSDKPEAKPFQRWVTHEVLPISRKTGRYDVRPRTKLDAIEADARAVVEHVREIPRDRDDRAAAGGAPD